MSRMQDWLPPEKWSEPAPSELETAARCREALEAVAREATKRASATRPEISVPDEPADLSRMLASIRGLEIDPASLAPEEMAALERFVEHATTALEFSDRVRLGHRDGLDIRNEMYGLVVRSLRDIADQSPEYRDALARALSVPQKGEASLPLDLVKGTSDSSPAPDQSVCREPSRVAQLAGMMLALGSLAIDLLKEGVSRVAALASATLSPVASLFSAAAALAGLRPPESREVWRGGDHSRSALFGRQKEHSEGKILGDDPNFFVHLAVTDAYVLTGRDGTMTRLDRYLDSRGGASAIDAFYPRRSVCQIAESGKRSSHETECQFDISPGSRCLPLSPFYGVTGLSFYDRKGRRIESAGAVEIREGLLGGVVVDAPPNARRVAYRVVAKDRTGIEAGLYESLRGALPKLETYMTPPQKVFVELLHKLDLDGRQKSRLWLATAAAAGFIYTKDDFVQRYLRKTGDNLNEVISGLRMGTCDSFAFHAAVMLSNLGLPAVSIVGATARKKQQDFLMNPGHAQAAVPFVDGIEIFDLTTLTRDRKPKCLGFLERRAELRALAGSNGMSALQSAEIVREKLTGRYRDPHLSQQIFGYDQARAQDEKAPPHLVPSFNQSDLKPESRGAPLGKARSLEAQVLGALGDYFGLVRLTEDSYDRTLPSVLSSDVAKIARGVDAMVNRLELERAIDICRGERSLGTLFKFLKDNSACAQIDDASREALPPEYAKLAGYDPQTTALSVIADVLTSQESDSMKREAAAWLIEQLRPSENPACGIFDDYLRYEMRIGEASLRASKAATLARKEILDAMTDEELIGFGAALHQNVAVWVMNGAVVEGERLDGLDLAHAVAHGAPDATAEIGRAIDLIAGEIVRRGLNIPEETASPLLAWSALLLRFGSELGVAEPFRGTFAKLLCAAGGPTALLPVFEQGRKFVVDALVSAVKGSPVEWIDTGMPTREAATDLERAFRERLAREISPHHEYATALDALATLGFHPDLSSEADRIEEAARKAIRAARRTKGEPLIAVPGPQAPASELLFEYGSDNGATLLRSLFAISRRGGLDERQIVEAWPGRTDEPVAAHLLSHLRMSPPYSRRPSHLIYQNDGPEQLSFAPRQLASLSSIFTESSSAARSVIDHLEARGAFDHPFDSLLDRIAVRHPVQWSKFVSSLVSGTDGFAMRHVEGHREAVTRGLIARLLEESSPEDRYAGLRWVAAEQLNGQQDERDEPALLSRWRSAAARNPAILTSEEEARTCLSSFTSPVVVGDRELSTLSWRTRAAVLDAYALTLTWEHNSRYALWRDAGLPQGVVSVLGDRRPITEDSKGPSAEIWERLHRLHRSPLDIARVLESAEKVADRIGRARPRSAGLSYYLYERTGLLAPLSPAGDFDSMRCYVQGDDLRMVDWKASARLDRVVTKQKREPEARPIALVVDADWLSQGYESFRSGGDNYPQLRELFVQLLLAERQGVDLDLYIAPRGDMVHFPNVLRRRRGPDAFRTESFQRNLSEWVRACGELARDEQVIFGKGHEPARVAVSGDGLQLRRGTILVAAVAEKNRALTLGPLESFGKRGIVVNVLRAERR